MFERDGIVELKLKKVKQHLGEIREEILRGNAPIDLLRTNLDSVIGDIDRLLKIIEKVRDLVDQEL